jgi:WD40 repeat protein
VDGTVRLWEAPSGQPLAVLQGHTGMVYGVGLAGDGRLVASGGLDGTVRLWEARDPPAVGTPSGENPTGVLLRTPGQPVATLRGHTGAVWGVALTGDGRLLASGGDDGAVRLWDPQRGPRSGACLRTLRSDRRYERLDITGLTGVTEAQRAALLTLGAFDREAASV